MISLSRFFIIVCTPVLMLASCSPSPSLLGDKAQCQLVRERFNSQKELAKHRGKPLFGVMGGQLSDDERSALEFLYAYMPLSDLANYDGDFYLSQVRYALKARETFAWGHTVPNDIFLHFVLPYRVNNEDLDSARIVFFEELKGRVAHLSMKDAALEVNHWCHEKVSYQPTDGRTSAPLSTVRSAFGRCGEESTFTVTAMRAVGIPARQIYTPRWAHSDDNHAWVEVWVDGKWHFLGACEPEPDLNMGWFAGPATRAMLLHTRVYGQYATADDVVTRDERYTELNVIPSYAPAKRVFVKVTDAGVPVPQADVEFQLYNYAEFYPIAKAKTDSNGICSLLTGYGDLIVWASANQKTAYQKVRIANTDTLVLALAQYAQTVADADFELIPPPPGAIAEASEQGREENTRRLHAEDSIRNAYERTFIDSAAIAKVAADLKADFPTLKTLFKQSCGNWQVIKTFLYQNAPSDLDKALSLLKVISDKDRRDVRLAALQDHFGNSDAALAPKGTELFNRYVLNPRVSYELVTPYKKSIRDYFGENFVSATQKDMTTLLTWVKDSIEIQDKANTSRNPIHPAKLLELRVSDKASRDIFVVAAFRSFGIPARLEESRRIPQVYANGQWADVSFETLETVQLPKGSVEVTWKPASPNDPRPEYYKHFTIAKFNGSTFRSLDFEYSNLFDKFPASLLLDTGRYMMVTGLRQPDGTVWARRSYFSVEQGKKLQIPVAFATVKTGEAKPRVTLDLKQPLVLFGSEHKVDVGKLASTNGLVMVWIDPDKEPTKHLLNDFARLKEALGTWKGSILLVLNPSKITPGFDPAKYTSLPANVKFVVDGNSFLSGLLLQLKESGTPAYPVSFVVTDKAELVYRASGYKIGAGDEILSNLKTYCQIKH